MICFAFQGQRRAALKRDGPHLPILSKHRGTYIVAAYMFMKVLYLVNAIGQIFLMEHFLGHNAARRGIFGWTMLQNKVRGESWQITQVFPRVAFCHVKTKVLGVLANGVTAQCALPVNMLNEMLYIFLWWWVSLVALVTGVYLIQWGIRFCRRKQQADYIAKYINFADFSPTFYQGEATDFALRFLRVDGIFLIRMIRMNAGDITAAGIVNCLWQRFQCRLRERTVDLFNGLQIVAPDIENCKDGSIVGNKVLSEINYHPGEPQENKAYV